MVIDLRFVAFTEGRMFFMNAFRGVRVSSLPQVLPSGRRRGKNFKVYHRLSHLPLSEYVVAFPMNDEGGHECPRVCQS